MQLIKRHTLTAGIIAMFALTWPFYSSLGPFVGYGLAAGTLIVTALARGWPDTKALLRRFLIWRVGLVWYVVALFGPFLLYLAAIALQTLLGGALPDFTDTIASDIFGRSTPLILFLIPFFLVDAIMNGEELAWRGFVLPRYQAKFTALASSGIVGLMWGFWHLPRFVPTGDWQGLAYAILHNVAISVPFTWVYNSTRGSLLLVTLLHAALNTSYVFLPVSSNAGEANLMQPSVVVIEYLAAAVMIVTLGRSDLSRLPRVTEQDAPNRSRAA